MYPEALTLVSLSLLLNLPSWFPFCCVRPFYSACKIFGELECFDLPSLEEGVWVQLHL